jgi:hypothetical protein
MAHLDRVSIWIGAHSSERTDRAPGANNVLYDELLAKRARHVLADDASSNVSRPTCGERNDHGDRSRWICLRRRDTRHCRESSSARCQMEKLSSVGKPHDLLPAIRTVSCSRHGGLLRRKMFFGTVRPPIAFSLPVRSRDYGTCPWQLITYATPFRPVGEGGHSPPLFTKSGH